MAPKKVAAVSMEETLVKIPKLQKNVPKKSTKTPKKKVQSNPRKVNTKNLKVSSPTFPDTKLICPNKSTRKRSSINKDTDTANIIEEAAKIEANLNLNTEDVPTTLSKKVVRKISRAKKGNPQPEPRIIYKRNLSKSEKLELANEVAAAQLIKPKESRTPEILQSLHLIIKVQEPAKRNNLRSKKTKNKSIDPDIDTQENDESLQQNELVTVPEPSSQENKKTPRKQVTRARKKKSDVQTLVEVSECKAIDELDVTEGLRDTEQLDLATTNVVAVSENFTTKRNRRGRPKKLIPNKKLIPEKELCSTRSSGENKIQNDSKNLKENKSQLSNDLINVNEKFTNSAMVSDTELSIMNAANPIKLNQISDNRKTPISETFSWANDISSSNTTTSKGLVCLNGKVPKIQLFDCRKSNLSKSASSGSVTPADSCSILVPYVKTSEIRKRKQSVKCQIEVKKLRLRPDSSAKNRVKKFTTSKDIVGRTVTLSKDTSSSTNNSVNNFVDRFDICKNASLTKSNKLESNYLCTNAPLTKNNKIEFDCSSTPDLTQKPVSLSSSDSESSLSSHKSDSDSTTTLPEKSNNLISQNLDRNLNCLDLEFLNWLDIEDENMDKEKPIVDLTFQILKQEADAIKLCQVIRQIVSKSNDTSASKKGVDPHHNNMSIDAHKSELELPNVNQENISDPFRINRELNVSENDLLGDRAFFDIVKMKSNESKSLQNDDKDVLSIYAESITAMEPVKEISFKSDHNVNILKNNSNIPSKYCKNLDEVTNKPIRHTIHAKELKQSIKTKTICEKQSADSTSVYKEDKTPDKTLAFNHDNAEKKSESEKINHVECEASNVVQDINNLARQDITVVSDIENANNAVKTATAFTSQHHDIASKSNAVANDSNETTPPNMPKLIGAIYRPVKPAQSAILRGYCFFYNIMQCKNNNCKFSHIFIDVAEVKNRLAVISNHQFFREYLLLRKHKMLKKKLLHSFLEESINRDLTRASVEMAVDANSLNNPAKTLILESVLLYLNNKNLDVCEDILMYPLDFDYILGDLLMSTIAHTQNFSRFKSVFTKLTDFLISQSRRIDFNDATQIFERICILPYEEKPMKSVIDVIMHTDPNIFKNSLMGNFEKKLSTHNSELYYKFKRHKAKVHDQIIAKNDSKVHPKITQDNYETRGKSYNADSEQQRYTSPDTTHLENLQNKPSEETPVITRTIDSNNKVRTYIDMVPSTGVKNQFNEHRPLPSSGGMNRSPFIRPPMLDPPKFRHTWRRGNEASYMRGPSGYRNGVFGSLPSFRPRPEMRYRPNFPGTQRPRYN